MNAPGAIGKKAAKWKEGPVGVAARLSGAGHFAVFEFIDMVTKGKALPQLTMDPINDPADRTEKPDQVRRRHATTGRLRRFQCSQ
jgi:hypothetical protein